MKYPFLENDGSKFIKRYREGLNKFNFTTTDLFMDMLSKMCGRIISNLILNIMNKIHFNNIKAPMQVRIGLIAV